MLTCRRCRFATELDDAAIPESAGQCICLRCYARETHGALPMPTGLQRQVVAVLAGLEPQPATEGA